MITWKFIGIVVYWSVSSSRGRGGDGLKRVEGGIFILAHCKYHFIKEHENLVYDPTNIISNPL